MNAAVLAFFPGSMGPLELLVIFVVILLLFGPSRLPEIARSIGRALNELRRASDEFRHEIMSIDTEPAKPPPNVGAASGTAPAIDGELIDEGERHGSSETPSERPEGQDGLAG